MTSTTEPTLRWVTVVEPWRFNIGFECGTHWYNFWRRGIKFRTYGHQDEKNGTDFRGFAIGAIMVSWGKHCSFHLEPLHPNS